MYFQKDQKDMEDSVFGWLYFLEMAKMSCCPFFYHLPSRNA